MNVYCEQSIQPYRDNERLLMNNQFKPKEQ